MFCAKCGTKITEDARFCTNCGAKVLADESKKAETENNISVSNDSSLLSQPNNNQEQSKKEIEAEKEIKEIKEDKPEEKKEQEEKKEKKTDDNDEDSYQSKTDVQYLEEYEQFIAAFFGITGSLDKKKNQFIEGYSHSFKFYDSKPNILKFLLDLRFGDKSLPLHDIKAILSCVFLIPFAYLYSLGAKKSAVISSIVVALIIIFAVLVESIWVIWFPFMMIVFYLIPKLFHIEFSRRMKLAENEADHNAKLEKFKSMCKTPTKNDERKIAGISFAAAAAVFFISVLLFSGSIEGKYVQLVKNSYFNGVPEVDVEELIKGTIKNAKWSEGVGEDDGRNYVNVRGDMMGFDVLIQFRINESEDGWVVNAVEMDGEAQPIGNVGQDLYNIYVGKEALKEYF